MQHPGCAVGGAKRKTEDAYTTSTSSGQAPGNLTTITKYLDESTTVATTMAYDETGNLIRKVDPAGNETIYTYTGDGNFDTVTTAQGTWEYDYDAEGRLSIVTDPFSHTRSREYDADGNVKAVKVNGETVSTYTYDADGNLIQRTDAAGNVYQSDYNAPSTGSGQAPGQLVGQRDPEGASFQYEYDANGRLSKTIDGNGNAIFREYGSDETSSSGSACLTCGSTPLLGGAGVGERLQKIIYPTFIKEFRYDEQGRVSEEIYTFNGGETYSVYFDYDAFGRLQSTTGPDPSTGSGQAGQSTTYFYDRMGRRIRVDDPSGQTTFEYDNWDNLIALTDAKNQRTEFEYDDLGRLKTEIRPMLQETTYEYYPAGSGQDAGRLWKMVDAKLQVTEYGYDDQGRLETITRSGPGVQSSLCTLSYDTDNNLASYSDGETSAEYDYDDLGRKIWEKVNYGDFTKEFSYSYYKNGLKKTFTAPDGTMYEYGYGNNNELREVRIPGLGAITIPDYTWNRPAKMTFPGGTQRTYGYDALMRLKSLTATDPGGNPLLDYAYTYDPTGNIVTKATEHGEYGYGYDSMSRLISADNPVLDDESYTYDAVGNRLTAADVNGTWNYNANNELLGFANVEYEYDANGNMTEVRVVGSVVWTYVYDAANRLVHVEDGTGSISADYYYDPFGRRLWKDVNGVRTYFLYADEGLVAEYDTSGSEIRSYGYRPDSTWTTNPLFLKQGGEYYFYQNDHLGTPQKLMGVNGAVVWSATYQAFGEATVDVSTVTNNLRFPGQYFDEETGLHYNWNRYYEPAIGRYIQADPIGLDSGINLFAYNENNPLTRRDIYGLSSCPPPGTDFTGCCGPDVTAALRGAFRQVRQIFDVEETDLFIKWKACTGLLGLDADKIGKIPQTQPELDLLLSPGSEYLPSIDTYKAGAAWDTDLWLLSKETKDGSGYKKPTDIWKKDIDEIRNGVGEPECERTVTFEKKCFHGNHLNYLLFGVMHQRCHQTFIEMRGLQEELHKPFEEEYSRIFQEIAEERKIRLLGELPGLTQFPGGTELINSLSTVNLGEPWSEDFAARLAALFKLNYLISADLNSMSHVEIGLRILERVQTMSIVRQITRAGYQSDRVNVPEPTYHNRCYVDVDHAGSVSSMMWRWEPWWGSISKEESEWDYLPEEE